MNQLPIRTTVDDINKVCAYLQKKPTGASIREAKSVIGDKVLDGRKLSAYKSWGIIEDQEHLKLTNLGRKISKDNGIYRADGLREIIKSIDPYVAIIEKSYHEHSDSITATDLAVHWHDHFKDNVSTSDKILNDQAVCFFHMAEGADLGSLTVGRKGAPTRFDFNRDSIKDFIDETGNPDEMDSNEKRPHESSEEKQSNFEEEKQTQPTSLGQAIFLAHGKNKKPLEQLKGILEQFKIPYKIVVEEPNLGRPIGEKVAQTMQQCNCAVLIFTADQEFVDANGKKIYRPSENVIYELGAASYLYGERIVIIKEENVEFPSNFKDLGFISFSKDELNSKAMDIIKELIGFDIIKIST